MIVFHSIIRISGQTVDGFPHITYSRINNDEINTYGKIFVDGEFVELVFDENIIEYKDDLKTNKITFQC